MTDLQAPLTKPHCYRFSKIDQSAFTAGQRIHLIQPEHGNDNVSMRIGFEPVQSEVLDSSVFETRIFHWTHAKIRNIYLMPFIALNEQWSISVISSICEQTWCYSPGHYWLTKNWWMLSRNEPFRGSVLDAINNTQMYISKLVRGHDPCSYIVVETRG